MAKTFLFLRFEDSRAISKFPVWPILKLKVIRTWKIEWWKTRTPTHIWRRLKQKNLFVEWKAREPKGNLRISWRHHLSAFPRRNFGSFCFWFSPALTNTNSACLKKRKIIRRASENSKHFMNDFSRSPWRHREFSRCLFPFRRFFSIVPYRQNRWMEIQIPHAPDFLMGSLHWWEFCTADRFRR